MTSFGETHLVKNDKAFHVLKYDRAKTGTEFNFCSCSLADKTKTTINVILVLLFWPQLLEEHSPHSTVFELLSIDWITNLETHSKDFRCCLKNISLRLH